MYVNSEAKKFLAGYSKLSTITVSKKNTQLTVVDNVLYKKREYLQLLVYPFDRKASVYIIPSNASLYLEDWKMYPNLETIQSLNPYLWVMDKYVLGSVPESWYSGS